MRRHRRTRGPLFGPIISVLAVLLGLVLVGPISPANADSGLCDVSGGYVKFDSSSGSETLDWGTLNWSGTDINYTVLPGYSIGLCVKAGTAVDTTSVDGPASGTFQTPPTGPQGQRQQISHIGYKILESPPPPPETPKDANATVDITPATCDTGETASEGATQNASWVPASDVTGPGSYSFTANADSGHQFGDGRTEKAYSGNLAGPDTSLCAPETPKDASATVDITPATCDTGETASEGATQNASWVPADDATGPGSYSFTANADSGHQFGDGRTEKAYTGNLAGPDTSLCENTDPPGNNGSIKVDDDGLPGCSVGGSDSTVCDNGVGNDPHLGCQFYVEWYNYEANATSTVSFDVQAPTGGSVSVVQGDTTVQLDGDGPEGGSDGGFDGSELYQLAFTDAPQPNGEYHVTVTTHTTSSNGSDTKTKTFWVEGNCTPPTDEDATATVDLSGPDCTTGETATPGDIENATWDSTEPTEGPGEYSYTATADDGHVFPAGPGVSEDGTTKTFTGTLSGDLAGTQGCVEVPGTQIRTEPFLEQGCNVGGVHEGTMVFTTTFTWDEELGEYVGTEDDGVLEDETFTPYTAQQLIDLKCVDVEGVQGHSGHHGGNQPPAPEVKGDQVTVVPTQVEAGLAGTPARTPVGGGSSLPLWALSLGAGLFLTGAGRLRRASKTAR